MLQYPIDTTSNRHQTGLIICFLLTTTGFLPGVPSSPTFSVAPGNECSTRCLACKQACKQAFNVFGYSLLNYPHICNCSFPNELADSEEDCLGTCRMYHMNGGCYFNKSSLMCKASRLIEIKNNDLLDPSIDILETIMRKTNNTFKHFS